MNEKRAKFAFSYGGTDRLISKLLKIPEEDVAALRKAWGSVTVEVPVRVRPMIRFETEWVFNEQTGRYDVHQTRLPNIDLKEKSDGESN